MGCSSSKRVEATIAADVYRPAPTSFALFDINTIEEPWILPSQGQQEQTKPSHLPAKILEKLNTLEDVPHSWSEVSKALEDLKPALHEKPTKQIIPQTLNHPQQEQFPTKPEKTKNPSQKNLTFHTLEELESKLAKKPDTRVIPKQPISQIPIEPTSDSDVRFKPVKQNSFILRDRLLKGGENNSDRKIVVSRKKDPLSGFQVMCPPRGEDAIVFYSTSLRGVRRTFEDCKRVRSVLENYQIPVDERDVSLHSEFLGELKELLGEGVSVPRLFVKGRYIGGVEEVVELNEEERLWEVLNTVGGKRWGLKPCEACGGMRFMPCLDCNGSCKVLNEEKVVVRCSKCNENGLVQCPVCSEPKR